jgi:2-keto-3-deoxy-L-rhamnonate aldolase RhmA
MRGNRVKLALKNGDAVIGSEVSRFRSPEVARVYAAAGLDFIFIDMEHSSFSIETVADMILSARAADLVPLVRVPQAEYAWVARVLDLGAQGVIVPRVNTPRQVEEIVSWMRYPPEGIRGYACTAPQTDYRGASPAEFINANQRDTLCVIQIERQEAVDNLDEMLSVPGVDVACLGYMDLSVDLGIPGELEHPAMTAAIERMIEASISHGVAPGIIHPQMDMVLHWLEAGMRFVSYSTEAIMLQEVATAAAQRLRKACRERATEGGVRANGSKS